MQPQNLRRWAEGRQRAERAAAPASAARPGKRAPDLPRSCFLAGRVARSAPTITGSVSHAPECIPPGGEAKKMSNQPALVEVVIEIAAFR